MRREEVWRKVTQGIQEVSKGLPDSIIGIVRLGVAAQWERRLES